MKPQHIRSKLLKTMVLLNDGVIKHHIPETQLLCRESLRDMLNKHDMLYLKPDSGRFGLGVMRLDNHEGLYCLHLGSGSKLYRTFSSMAKVVESMCGERPYIVQQGVRMLTYSSNPFDIRVMVQRTPEGTWDATGYLARVAARQRVVTNFHCRGTPMVLEEALFQHMSKIEGKALITSMSHLCESVAVRLSHLFPSLKDVGVDIALDNSGRIWILEANTRPMIDVFKKLGDQEIYDRIRQYKRAMVYLQKSM